MSRSKRRSGQAQKPKLPPHRYINNAAEWGHCLQALRAEPRIAVDLEANSMYAYREQICLIQLSIPGQDYIVDPLADQDLEKFGALIADASVEKVFHAAEYDLILMKQEFGWELHNLFDTMWAARILGYERVGLANILADLYQVRLDKRHQRANWCRRPLRKEQLAYAQADTHYLLELRDHFSRALEVAGRTTEAQEIFAEQSHITLPSNSFDPDSFWSIHGARRLPAQGKAILKALNIYRDREAKRRDRPPFKVLQDRTLLQLAREAPRDRQQLSRVHGMSKGQMRRYGDDILRIIGEHQGAPAPRRPPRRPRPAEAVANRYELLRTWRKERARRRGVESDVVMSRDALWALARANPQSRAELAAVDELGPWRRRTYGDEILRLLAR